MSFVDKVLMPIGLPLIDVYCAVKEDVFLNTYDINAEGLEALGNWLLTPARFLFGGRKVTKLSLENQTCEIKNQFKNNQSKGLEILKTALSILLLVPSLILGCAIKGSAYLSEDTRIKHGIITNNQSVIGNISTVIKNNKQKYKLAGIETEPNGEYFNTNPTKKPTLEDPDLPIEIQAILKDQKKDVEGLGEISKILTDAGIVWWADYGTLLGIYRHNGMIPWDHDIDLSILAPDHIVVKKLLKENLDKSKYDVWDFSPPSKPESILKVRIKETNLLIDVYHYTFQDAKEGEELSEDGKAQTKKEITYEFSHIHEWYIPEEALKREYTRSYEPGVLFPLKKAKFDGVDVFVPNQIEDYLLSNYANSEESKKKSKEERLKDLAPCKVWDPEKKVYAQVPDHPYFKECAFNQYA